MEEYVNGEDFNPRSPCGERRDGEQYEHIDFTISTHAPRAGSDLIAVFLSPPCYISTHAPRAGSDLMHRMLKMSKNDFNPRSPCGERLSSDGKAPIQLDFNPRSPCGERRPILQQFGLMHNFNPRSPCGERRALMMFCGSLMVISTHAPRAGSDYQVSSIFIFKKDFNPRSPCGERPPTLGSWTKPSSGFQPTLPVRGATYEQLEITERTEISTHAPRAGSDYDKRSF